MSAAPSLRPSIATRIARQDATTVRVPASLVAAIHTAVPPFRIPDLHTSAAVAKAWHEDRRLAAKAYGDLTDHDLLIDCEGETETHEDMAQIALNALEVKFGSHDAIGLGVWTVSPSGHFAIEWRVRWDDEQRREDRSPILWIQEIRHVAWCSRCAEPHVERSAKACGAKS